MKNTEITKEIEIIKRELKFNDIIILNTRIAFIALLIVLLAAIKKSQGLVTFGWVLLGALCMLVLFEIMVWFKLEKQKKTR